MIQKFNVSLYITFTVPIEKKVTRMIKMENKLQKIHAKDLLIAQDLWQALYQYLSIILLKKLIKLNVNTEAMIKKCETCRIKYKYCDRFLECTNIKNNLIEYKWQ